MNESKVEEETVDVSTIRFFKPPNEPHNKREFGYKKLPVGKKNDDTPLLFGKSPNHPDKLFIQDTNGQVISGTLKQLYDVTNRIAKHLGYRIKLERLPNSPPSELPFWFY